MADRVPLHPKETPSSGTMNCFSSDNDGLPSGLPKNWPNHDEEDLKEFPHRIISVGEPQQYFFKDNFVKTSKYTLYDFIPKFLLEEFNPRTKIANVYFFCIALLQMVPAVSNTGGLPTTFAPLSGVVMVDALFQALEDIARHAADKISNSSKSIRYEPSTGRWIPTAWHMLRVGDFVKISSREQIPADLLVLATAEEEGMPARGQCYVETKQLDGETNLKLRQAMPNTMSTIRTPAELKELKGSVQMEHPNNLIDTFDGSFTTEENGKEAIGPNNVLLRGCVLRNTDWIIGIVVNSGHDTKIMMTSRETKQKSSNMEFLVSKQIIVIVCLLMAICLIGASCATGWNAANDIRQIWYLGYNGTPNDYIVKGGDGENWIIMFFYFFLLHATFIPVSLYVSMTLARALQSYFMQKDEEMYYDPIDAPMAVRTMTLNEELGQISHIFSDKTGTLTCNVMDFRKFSANGIIYGSGITEIGKASWRLQGKAIPAEVLEGEARSKAASKPHVTFWDPKYEEIEQNPKHPEADNVNLFFRVLSICHDVIAENVDKTIKLSASNPDDEALVCAAEHFGYKFYDRRDKFIQLKTRSSGGQTEEVELLESIAFSSKRKRMSVIVRETNGKLKLYIKGADTVINERLRKGQSSLVNQTNADMEKFSDEGLRCLLVGFADIDEKWFAEWQIRYKDAKTDLDEVEKMKKLQPNKIESLEEEIEKDILLIGSTALEDRLQDGVPEAVALLAKAGIKIWVLTGDKEETAINIAVACNLVQPTEYMEQVIVNKNTAPTRAAMMALFDRENERYSLDQLERGEDCLPRALIMDGPSIAMTTANKAMMLSDAQECTELRNKLLTFSQRCKAVVGCRVSPDQKREMVDLIKSNVDGVRTLAVGDGANDVAMIQEAHIGVGIRGEEGLQAVNSSDYAIAQFRFLTSLLLKHGRYNYTRMAALVFYMFYKNIFMSMGQFWFNFNNAWSGQKYYNEMVIQAFNLLYTSFPIVALAAYDKDITTKSAFIFPQDYQECVKNEHFTNRVFAKWLITAILESILVSVLPLYIMQNSGPGGSSYSFWAAGTACYTCVVVIVNAKLLFMQSRWHWVNVVIIVLSMIAYLASNIVFSSVPNVSILYQYYDVGIQTLGNASYWSAWIVVCALILCKDMYFCVVERAFNYRNYHIIQEYEVEHGLADMEILEAAMRRAAMMGGDSSGSTGSSTGLSKLPRDSNGADASEKVQGRSPRSVGDSMPSDL